MCVLCCCSHTARIFREETWPYGACYLLCITRTDTHQLVLWMTRRLGQQPELVGVGGAETEIECRQRDKQAGASSMKI